MTTRATPCDGASSNGLEEEFDFSSFDPMFSAAKREPHAGDLESLPLRLARSSPHLHARLRHRSAKFSKAVARHIREQSDRCRSTRRSTRSRSSAGRPMRSDGSSLREAPRRRLKRQLVLATIAAIEAVRDVDARARIVSVERLIHVELPKGKPDPMARKRLTRTAVRRLGHALGHTGAGARRRPKYLDIVGVNSLSRQPVGEAGRQEDRLAHPSPRLTVVVPFQQTAEGRVPAVPAADLHRETSHVGSGRAEVESVKWRRSSVPLSMWGCRSRGVPVSDHRSLRMEEAFALADNSRSGDFERDAEGNFVACSTPRRAPPNCGAASRCSRREGRTPSPFQVEGDADAMTNASGADGGTETPAPERLNGQRRRGGHATKAQRHFFQKPLIFSVPLATASPDPLCVPLVA